MRRSGARGSAGYCSRPPPLLFLSQLCSASCMDGASQVGPRTPRADATPPIDDPCQQGVHTMSADDASVSNPTRLAPSRERKRRHLWLVGLPIMVVGGAIIARLAGRALAEESLARATLEAA